MIEKAKEYLTEITRGEEKDLEDDSLTWNWQITESLGTTGVALGEYNRVTEEINIHLGSIMWACDSEEDMLGQLEITVLHELTHWAAQHKGLSRHARGGHATRYRKMLSDVTNYDCKKERDMKPETFRKLKEKLQ